MDLLMTLLLALAVGWPMAVLLAQGLRQRRGASSDKRGGYEYE